MKLECDTFRFYDNGIYKTFSKWDINCDCYDNDIKKSSTSIRIFGTRKQIRQALNDYCEASGLNLDEAYDFKTHKPNSYWGDVFGDDLESYNKDVSYKLKEYKKKYKNKALIINLN